LLDKQDVFHKIILSRLVDSSPLRLASVSLFTGLFMTHRQDVAGGHDLVTRWCTLAEQRLRYLTEMFEDGRWRRYYSEHAFLENIQEAKTAVERWRRLSMPETARQDPPIDIAWRAMLPDQVPAEPASDIAVGTEPEFVSAEEAPSAPVVDMEALEQALSDDAAPGFDFAAIEQRYPLLRNAL